MSNTDRTALVVGASRGLGLVLAHELLRRGWNVVATTRTDAGELATIADVNSGLRLEQFELNDADNLATLRRRLSADALDLVLVNAAINRSTGSLTSAPVEEFAEVMITNAYRPIQILDALHDIVAPAGTVAVMSSEQGSISSNDELGFEVYKASKAALNQLMRSYATRHASDGHTKLLIDPGHNRTHLGGQGAPLRPEESIPLVVDMIEANAGRGGLQFLDRHGATVPW